MSNALRNELNYANLVISQLEQQNAENKKRILQLQKNNDELSDYIFILQNEISELKKNTKSTKEQSYEQISDATDNPHTH